MLIKWSFVVNFFTYLSDLHDNAEDVMIFESIKEISCPKTEVPKKCVVLSIVDLVCGEPKLLKKRERKTNISLSLDFYRTTVIYKRKIKVL
jgi:hypothetical protein